MNTDKKLVLLRHGESQWNKENKFTGWYDIDLSEKGYNEAKLAGDLLKKNSFIFDYAFTSLLKRAIHTLWCILDALDLSWISVEKSWKLNERHYGALQGLNKSETIKKYGEKIVKGWRRSFSIQPPKINVRSTYYPGNDIKYSHLNNKDIPLAESLEKTTNRVVSYWNKNILPRMYNGERVIIVAHGNSLRGLIKYLDNIDEKKIIDLNIPTGIPIVYLFNKSLEPKEYYYL